VRSEVLDVIADSSLAVYAVWEPILMTDSETSARRAVSLLPDPRVRHYWTDAPSLGLLYQEPIGLRAEPAWDVYLVYAPGATWEEGALPPAPDWFMHQLGDRLPEDRAFDAPKLAGILRDIIGRR
jgi:hypothetical protein